MICLINLGLNQLGSYAFTPFDPKELLPGLGLSHAMKILLSVAHEPLG